MKNHVLKFKLWAILQNLCQHTHWVAGEPMNEIHRFDLNKLNLVVCWNKAKFYKLMNKQKIKSISITYHDFSRIVCGIINALAMNAFLISRFSIKSYVKCWSKEWNIVTPEWNITLPLSPRANSRICVEYQWSATTHSPMHCIHRCIYSSCIQWAFIGNIFQHAHHQNPMDDSFCHTYDIHVHP